MAALTWMAERSLLAGAALACLSISLGGAFYPAEGIVAGLAAAVTVAVCALARTGRLEPEELLLGGLIVWATLGALVSTAAPLAAKEQLVAWLVAWMLYVGGRRSSAAQGLALAALAVTTGLMAMSALLDFATNRSVRAGGLFESPNILAALIVPALPAVTWWLWTRSRAGACAFGILGTLAVGLSSSRAGVLALVVGLGVLLPPGRKRAVAVASAFCLAVALIAYRFVARPDSLAWFRLEIWKAAATLVAAHPVLGVSAGALPDASGTVRIAHVGRVAIHQYHMSSADSTILGIAVETGLVGLLLVALALCAAVWRRSEPGRRSRVLCATSAAMATLAVFHDFVGVAVVLWWWAVILAILTPLSSTSGKPSLPRCLVASALAWTVLWGLAQPALARFLWDASPRDRTSVDRAMRLEPWLAEAAQYRVRALLAQPEWSRRHAAEALYWSRRAEIVHSANVGVWVDLARVLARSGLELGLSACALEESRLAYAHACDIEPKLPWFWLEWARLERNAGDLVRAKELALRATEAEPQFVGAWLFVAKCALELGETSDARAALTRADEARTLTDRATPGYECDLLAAPAWQWRELESALSEQP